jgi:vacuolar-type H+-ATPase subunit B/Vma2
LAWELLTNIDSKYLVRLDQKWIDKYHPTEKKE